jgi:DNA-binding response OmpR family regulator
MPKMDGFDLLKQIKTHPKLMKQDVKTIMLSGRKKEDDIVRGLKLGADDYMAKPFSLVELEIRVQRMIGQG